MVMIKHGSRCNMEWFLYMLVHVHMYCMWMRLVNRLHVKCVDTCGCASGSSYCHIMYVVTKLQSHLMHVPNTPTHPPLPLYNTWSHLNIVDWVFCSSSYRNCVVQLHSWKHAYSEFHSWMHLMSKLARG